MSKRRPYVRPMDGWWLKNPYYVRYMSREATSLFVGVYALILLAGMVSLACGETAYNNWLMAMTNPVSIGFHLAALAAAIYHTITWFAVAPKVMPALFLAGKRLPDIAITTTQYAIAVVLYLGLFCMVWRV